MKEEWKKELKDLRKKNKDNVPCFTLKKKKKYCEELNICSFVEANANKKDCELNAEIQYRKKYLRVKLIKK